MQWLPDLLNTQFLVMNGVGAQVHNLHLFGTYVGNINHSQIRTWISVNSVRVSIFPDLVGQSDKREESMIRQCKPVEWIYEAKLLGRQLLKSLMVSQSIHVESIFRLPINRRRKL